MANAELADGTIVVGVTDEQRAQWDSEGTVYKLTEDDGAQTIENFVSPRVVEAPEE